MLAHRLLVITSCTGEKLHKPSNQLTLADFRDPHRLSRREAELSRYRAPAHAHYTGNQHIQLMRGIRRLRQHFGQDAVALQIVSAGYGLIPEDRLLVPYEVTFNTRGKPAARAWSQRLGIPAAIRHAIPDFPFVMFLLGARYLDALDPPLSAIPGQRLMFLAAPSEFRRLQSRNVTLIPAGRPEATRYGAGTIALKGRMFDLLSQALIRQGPSLTTALMQDDTPATFTLALSSYTP